MNPEEKALRKIDAQLASCGWVVQSKDAINLSSNRGMAVCELSCKTGEPDYTLFVMAKPSAGSRRNWRASRSGA